MGIIIFNSKNEKLMLIPSLEKTIKKGWDGAHTLKRSALKFYLKLQKKSADKIDMSNRSIHFTTPNCNNYISIWIK